MPIHRQQRLQSIIKAFAQETGSHFCQLLYTKALSDSLRLKGKEVETSTPKRELNLKPGLTHHTQKLLCGQNHKHRTNGRVSPNDGFVRMQMPTQRWELERGTRSTVLVSH